MTPRRPAPARPGARRTSRPGPARGSRGASSGRGSKKSNAGTNASVEAEADTEQHDADHPAQAAETARPHLGGAEGLSLSMRLLILAGVVVLAFVVVFPSLRGYLIQRAQYDAVLDEIDEARATSTALEEELARWNDDEYVKAQARERLSYVMPGETTYVVVGADRFASDDPAGSTRSPAEERLPWYQELRESARVAGGQVEEEQGDDPAQQGWSTPTPRPTATPEPSATPSTAASVNESGDQQ